MSTQVLPTANTWYVNPTGKLIKVRMLSYTQGKLMAVLIEYLEGTSQCVSVEDWNKLDLNKHTWMPSSDLMSWQQ